MKWSAMFVNHFRITKKYCVIVFGDFRFFRFDFRSENPENWVSDATRCIWEGTLASNHIFSVSKNTFLEKSLSWNFLQKSKMARNVLGILYGWLFRLKSIGRCKKRPIFIFSRFFRSKPQCFNQPSQVKGYFGHQKIEKVEKIARITNFLRQRSFSQTIKSKAANFAEISKK